MNNMKKMVLLLLLEAASNSAKALDEEIRLQAGRAFTLHSKAEAVGTGLPPKYQWYRDGSPIEGATSPDYTIPAGQAVGSNVQFKRAAYTDGCAERMFTNTVTITWCNLLIGGVCWADANVAQPGTFAPRPDMRTEFYQWNQPAKAWSPSDPATGVAIDGWNSTITAPAWTATPCPEGWRLPTRADFVELDKAGGGNGSTNNVGSTWVTGGIRGVVAGINGRFYGPNHAADGSTPCSLPSAMVGCIFLPALGTRGNGGAHDGGTGGTYWASTQSSSTDGQRLYFNNSLSYPASYGNKAYGFNVRCVQ